MFDGDRNFRCESTMRLEAMKFISDVCKKYIIDVSYMRKVGKFVAHNS